MVPRLLSPKILQLATKFPVVSVTGPRQSGKTTLVKYLFPDYQYVNLENPDTRQAAQFEVDLLIDEGGKLYPFEIKAGQTVRKGFFKGVEVFNEVSGNDSNLASLIYGGDSSYQHPQGIQVRAWHNLPLFG